MSASATLTLPWPPSVNHYWRHRIAGPKHKPFIQVYVSKEGQEYRESVKRAVLRRWPGLLHPLAMRLRVVVLVNPPDRRARDLDNLGKGLLDSLKHAGVYQDDSRIDHLELVRSGRIGKPGTVDVTLMPMGS